MVIVMMMRIFGGIGVGNAAERVFGSNCRKMPHLFKAKVYFHGLGFMQQGHTHGCLQSILNFVNTVHKLNACALQLLDWCIAV